MDQLILNLPEDLVKKLRHRCSQEAIAPNEYIQELIVNALKDKDLKNKG